MKIRFKIERQVSVSTDVLEQKINIYLKKNYYRVIDRGEGYVIFINDEYSDRRGSRSDFHNRIGEGKFEFYATDEGANFKLIYFTPIWFPVLWMTIFGIGAIYAKTIVPIIMSFAFALPVVSKYYIMKAEVFDDVLAC